MSSLSKVVPFFESIVSIVMRGGGHRVDRHVSIGLIGRR